MRSLILLVFGIAAGSLLTIFAIERHVLSGQLLTTAPMCAVQVDTHDWSLFSDTQYGIELRFPPTHELVKQQNGLLIRAKTTDGAASDAGIVLTKERGGVQQKIDESMQQAAWKVSDRSAFALQGPYVSTDDTDPNAVTSTYLFVRDFPKQTTDNTIIRAVIHERLNDPVFRAAKMAKAGAQEEQLSANEQILSTFRFLSYDEIYGPQGYHTK